MVEKPHIHATCYSEIRCESEKKTFVVSKMRIPNCYYIGFQNGESLIVIIVIFNDTYLGQQFAFFVFFRHGWRSVFSRRYRSQNPKSMGS